MREDKKPNFADYNDQNQFHKAYDEALKKELLEVSREVSLIMQEYELTQQEACYVAVDVINKLTDITSPSYVTIKLNQSF